MAATRITSFTHAAEHAQQWVNELAEDLNWDERRAHHLLRSTLHAIRDWLSPEEMADLSAQLPTLVRGIYFEGWRPHAAPAAKRSREDFIERIRLDFGDDRLNDPAAAIAAVFRLLDSRLSLGEIVQVRNSMKKSLRDLWPKD